MFPDEPESVDDGANDPCRHENILVRGIAK